MGEKKTKILAEKLRAARENAGLSQGQVAKMLDYHRPTISEIEAGRRKVSAEEVSEFSDLYDVSVEWLLSRKEDEPDPAILLAARGLAKLKKEDLNAVLKFVGTLKKR